MTSIQETEVASTQPVVVRTADTESDVARLVREFSHDTSAETLSDITTRDYGRPAQSYTCILRPILR
ncbi:hypothetical protein PI124_g8912 [Phytophthora idaei]|nr:hypothetical protein PI125_g8754 [Phytophthora idaei]KAG3158059.1 hypothetical protein PI126_g8000 [Phytophthora idaei]KAG3246351.1 hypothetical protein PI124_g8912 [Phytophthora idaei]